MVVKEEMNESNKKTKVVVKKYKSNSAIVDKLQ
jgi:hypothetical protein